MARNPDGTALVQQTVVEELFDTVDLSVNTLALPYAAASLDKARARLIVRNHTRFVGGPLVDRVEVPTDAWTYAGDKAVRVDRAHSSLARYDAGAAFEFVYDARDPQVLGIGMAAVRDVVAFLRHDTSTVNPLRGGVDHALAHGQSQSGRFLKAFTYWGFNEDEDGRLVFAGVMPTISGAHAIAINERFGDTNATGRSYERHAMQKIEFPFTYDVRRDPLSGVTDGILRRCRQTSTCPKVMHVDGGNEAWLKAMTLVTTDGRGREIALPDSVRVYYVAGTQHGPSRTAAATAVCQQLSNPLPYNQIVRALFIALDDWATRGIPPPASSYPSGRDLVAPTPDTFPRIPGVRYTGWYNEVAVLDRSRLPAAPRTGQAYDIRVPRTNEDGNDVAGIKHPELAVPVGTHTGWALRRAPFADGEDCGLTGQFIPFAATRTEREAKGDPRLSVEERYRSRRDYVARIQQAAARLVSQRFLMREDADAIAAQALAQGALAGLPD